MFADYLKNTLQRTECVRDMQMYFLNQLVTYFIFAIGMLDIFMRANKA